jgi:hypothetical protein
MATAPVLYNNMATISPIAARLCSSSRASQHAAPKLNRAAPATRPIVISTVVVIGEPRSNETGIDGQTARARPVPTSTNAVMMKKYWVFMRSGQLGTDPSVPSLIGPVGRSSRAVGAPALGRPIV